MEIAGLGKFCDYCFIKMAKIRLHICWKPTLNQLIYIIPGLFRIGLPILTVFDIFSIGQICNSNFAFQCVWEKIALHALLKIHKFFKWALLLDASHVYFVLN